MAEITMSVWELIGMLLGASAMAMLFGATVVAETWWLIRTVRERQAKETDE